MTFEKDIDFGRVHDLTIEEVKAYPTFAHFTEKQTLAVIETLKLFSKIAYDFYKKDAKIL